MEASPVLRVLTMLLVATGIMAQGAIVTALFQRERTGLGQKIDLSLLETQVAALANIASNYLVANQEARRWGTAHESIVPYQAFRAKDDYITVAAANDKLWLRLCNILNRKDLAENSNYATNALRVWHRKELVAALAEEFEKKSCEEWVEALAAEGIPCGPINSMESLFRDPQVLHRRMIEEVDHPTIGRLRLTGIPVKYSAAKPCIRRPPPLLGEHTDEILAGFLSLSSGEIRRLRDQQII